jgi:uncharacterized membrane protein YeaQ/YmgE (transglycosylase-associated protein family)
MSVELDANGAKYVLVAIVLLGGLFGGIAAELFKTRTIRGVVEEGGWERRSRVTTRYSDWGGWASIVLGIVAAGIAMGLFDQVQDVTKVVPASGNTPATTTTVEKYDVWRVVAVTLIAGFSASKILALAQERLLALTTQKQFESALITTSAAAGAQAQQASVSNSTELAQQQAEVIQAIADSVLPGSGQMTPPPGEPPPPQGEPPPPAPLPPGRRDPG